MAFGGFDSNSQQPMSDINVTPLVDVMLVLVAIFLITAPLMTRAVRIDLPKAAAQPVSPTPEMVALSIDAEGRWYWNRQAVGQNELRARLAEAAARRPQPDIQLHADRNTRYEAVAALMAAVQNAALQKLQFVTEP